MATAESVKTAKCGYCGAEPGNDCTTSSGKVLRHPLGHRERRDAARAMRESMAPPKLKEDQELVRANKLGAAIWFIRTVGGVENARRLLNLAAEAIEEAPRGSSRP